MDELAFRTGRYRDGTPVCHDGYSETQNSVSNWATATFGDGGTNAGVAARTNEEFAELLRCLTSGEADMDRVGEELADVAILLYCLGTRLNSTVSLTSHAVPGLPEQACGMALQLVCRANAGMAVLLTMLALNDHHPEAGDKLAEIATIIAHAARHLGIDLRAAVDRKMAINRKRRWTVAGNGCGYHEDRPFESATAAKPASVKQEVSFEPVL